MKIFHHNDLDGRCAAAIAFRWVREEQRHIKRFELFEVDYKDKINVDQFNPGEYVVIVDFSFKPEVMIPILKKGVHVTWIDHHKTAAHYNYGVTLPGLRDFCEKGKSGCELTWEYFNSRRSIPRAVELIGDYDSWRLQCQPECFEFYEGLKMEDTNPESRLWDFLFETSWSGVVAGFPTALALRRNLLKRTEINTQGKAAIRYRDSYCEKICHDFGYEINWEGHKAFATNFYQFGSKGFGERMEKYDFCVAYIHDGKRFTVSLYSVKGVDVSEICKRYGGGGHKGAAGFVCDKLPWSVKG